MLHQLGTASFLDKSGIVRDNLSARLPDLNEPNPADATSRRGDSPLFPTALAPEYILIAALLIILLGMWSLSYFASRMLREDMEHVLGDQQLSTVTLIAAQIDEEIKSRARALFLSNILAAQAIAQVRLRPRILSMGASISMPCSTGAS